MIHARTQLFRLVQEFFETHLRGEFAWNDVEQFPAEKVEEADLAGIKRHRSKFPYGKVREIVTLRFGLYDLTVQSSHEAPPLGKITVSGPDGTLEENSLDPSAWERVGEFINQQQEIVSYV